MALKKYKIRKPLPVKATEHKFLKKAGSRKATLLLEAIIRNYINIVEYPLPIPKPYFFTDDSKVMLIGKDAWDLVTKKANEFNVSKVELLHHLINAYKRMSNEEN